MCGVTERFRGSRTTPRPQWARLYVLVMLMLAALAVVEALVSPGARLTVLRCGLVLGGFGAMARGARRHPARLRHRGRGGRARAPGAPAPSPLRPGEPGRSSR